MLSPSDYNCAVPQFTNGNYASNPINPLYIEEPGATDYNRGAEPLQTLPAQWWNWFINQFTARFNKLNLYVKNIFNELTQLLSIGNITPDGTEATPTITQIKDFFQTCYPDYMKTTSAIADTYVPKTTMINGHALSDNVTVTRSDLGLGTSATVNTGTAVDCIPTVGTALGTTDGQFLATDATGKLKPSGYTASCFRASTWTPTTVTNADKVCTSAATASANRYLLLGEDAYSATCCSRVYVGNCCKATFNPGTGVLTAKTFCGALSGNASTATKAGYATCLYNRPASGTASAACNVYFYTGCTNASCTALNFSACICGANGWMYGLAGIFAPYVRANDPGSTASKVCSVIINAYCTNNSCAKTTRTFTFCGSTGYMHGNVCGNVCGLATCASKNGSGVAFGTAATCAETAFRSCTWWPNSWNCGYVQCSLYSCVGFTSTCWSSYPMTICVKCMCAPSQGSYVSHICVCTGVKGSFVFFKPEYYCNCDFLPHSVCVCINGTSWVCIRSITWGYSANCCLESAAWRLV